MQNYYDDPREQREFYSRSPNKQKLAVAVVESQKFTKIMPLDKSLAQGTVFAELVMPYTKMK